MHILLVKSLGGLDGMMQIRDFPVWKDSLKPLQEGFRLGKRKSQ